jgi:superfamily I DNA/RNA helicase
MAVLWAVEPCRGGQGETFADTSKEALARLPAQDRTAVKVSVMDLQLDRLRGRGERPRRRCEAERHLLHVACTRARERLLVSGVLPGSEFIADLASDGELWGSER